LKSTKGRRVGCFGAVSIDIHKGLVYSRRRTGARSLLRPIDSIQFQLSIGILSLCGVKEYSWFLCRMEHLDILLGIQSKVLRSVVLLLFFGLCSH